MGADAIWQIILKSNYAMYYRNLWLSEYALYMLAYNINE